MVNINQTRKLLQKQKDFKERQLEVKRRCRVREFKQLVESLVLRGFSVNLYKDIQRYAHGIKIRPDECRDALYYARAHHHRNCPVYKE